MNRRAELRALAALFLRLGTTAFGGPAVHVALMEREVVQRLGWVTAAEFADLLAAANLIPGPNSTELAIHIGYRRAGYPGLLVAGLCFVVPATTLVLLLAAAYVAWGQLPAVHALLHGILPVVFAVVVQAIARMARATLGDRRLVGIAVLAAGAVLCGVHELLVLLLAGIAGVVPRPRLGLRLPAVVALPTVGVASATVAAASLPCTLPGLFWFFAKVGAVLYGSGYVLIAFLRADLVERWHWLDEAGLLAAVAAGQITPGPVFTTATFVGYLLGGVPGGLLATLGIFLPAFVFVAITAPLLPALRRARWARAALDGVAAASLALLAVAAVDLARHALVDATGIALAGIALVVQLRTRVSFVWLLLAGAAAGLLLA